MIKIAGKQMQVFHFFFNFYFMANYSIRVKFLTNTEMTKISNMCFVWRCVFYFRVLLIECPTEFIFKMLKSLFLIEPMVSSGSYCNINYRYTNYKYNVWMPTPKLLHLVIFYCTYIELLILCIITFSFTIIYKLVNIKFRFFYPFNNSL